MIRSILIAVLATLMMITSPALCADDGDGVRRDLRVLLVGPDPDNLENEVSRIMENYERSSEVYARHTASFRELLERHFDDVTVVYGSEYRPSMSAEADVTIFAAEIAEPLPRDFDHASIYIGYLGANLTNRTLGTKLDWL